MPERVGELKISNIGRDFEATPVVVETVEEATKRAADRDLQRFALIHSVDEFRIFTDSLVLQHGLPATIHNISLLAEHQVSFNPFYGPEDINIRPREITAIKFTPDKSGQFAIKHKLHGFTGKLVVEKESC